MIKEGIAANRILEKNLCTSQHKISNKDIINNREVTREYKS